MATRKKFEAVATIGTYKDRLTGEEKKRYQTVGTVFENDKGQLSLKLDAVPVSPEWSGWISLYEPKEREAPRPAPSRQSQPVSHGGRANSYQAQDEDDDIPF